MRAVEAAVGIPLDYTQDTLPLLDHYASSVPDSARSEVLALVAPMCGAYFGEVVRHHLPDARWHAPEAHRAWRLEFHDCFLHFNPVGVALEAIGGAPAAGWSAHLSTLDRHQALVAAALERLGGVGRRDYYRFAVRFEVIETAHASLRRLAADDPATFGYGPEVYAAAVLPDPEEGSDGEDQR